MTEKMHTDGNGLVAQRKRLRITGYILLGLGLAALVGLAALRTHAIVVRNKGEALKQRVLALKPGSSTLQDVREFVSEYGGPEDYAGRCDESECHASVGTYAFPFAHHKFDMKLLRMLGIRPAAYVATIDVIKGVVAHVRFNVFYRTSGGTWLTANTHVLDEFSVADRCLNPGLRRHPEYALASGPPGVPFVDAGVTKKAAADEYRRAQTLNLECVTAMWGCAPSDLMPLAYSDWLTDFEWERNNQQQLAKEKLQCQEELSSSGTRPSLWWATGQRPKTQ